jgi:hypothetical protein
LFDLSNSKLPQVEKMGVFFFKRNAIFIVEKNRVPRKWHPAILASKLHPASASCLLNAFDMFTAGHLSFGQWRHDDDRSATKRRDLSFWTNLAQVLERGDFKILFIADTLGHYDTYKNSAEPCFRSGTQFPMADPVIVSSGIPFLNA